MSKPPVQLNPTDQEILKAQQAIAVLPISGSRITLLMRRFWNVLLRHAQASGEAETYRAELSAILQGGEFDSGNIDVAKNTLRSMAKTTVEWNFVSGDVDDFNGRSQHWGVSALLADAELVTRGRKVYLEWSYSPKIRRHLIDPTRYVPLSISIYSSLRSGTAAALYEVCKRYINNANGLTNKAEWDWWRPRLTGVPNEDAEPVSEYKYFKRDTLVPAIREINKNTDIEVELLEFRTGRKITHLQFSGKAKSQSQLGFDLSRPLVDSILMGRILALGVERQTAIKLYGLRDEDALRATLDYVEERVRKGDVGSPAALFCDAIKKGYGVHGAQAVRKGAAPSPNPAPSSQKASAAPMNEEAEAAAARIRTFIDRLPQGERIALEDRFSDQLQGHLVGLHRRYGFRNKLVMVEFIAFCESLGYPDAYPGN